MFQTYAFVPNIMNPWWTVGSSVDLLFTNSLYFDSSVGSTAVTNLLSISRASIGYATNSDGTLTQFSNNVLRIGVGTGLLAEDTRTNVVLWCRDLTNAAWTPTNITAAKDQTGPDGVSNSASSITATAGNGTILQSITLATAAAFQSAYVKRITGTGTINMTMDNGSTWTAISPTSAWTQVTIPTQTLANPTVGFQIVTSGDKIAVDFVQNENGTFVSSPIPTTTTSAARAADVVTCIGDLETALDGTACSAVIDATIKGSLTQTWALMVGDGASTNGYIGNSNAGINTYVECRDATHGQLFTPLGNSQLWSTGAKGGFSRDGSGRSIVGGGGTVGTDGNVPDTYSPKKLLTGSPNSNPFFGYARRLTVWNSRLSDAALQALTAP